MFAPFLLHVLSAAALAAQPTSVGCTAVEAEAVSPDRLERELKPLARGEGAKVALLPEPAPGVEWDLGEKRRARLSVYLTRECVLGLSESVTGDFDSSSPDPNSAVRSFAESLRRNAPDWTLSVRGGVLAIERGGVARSTDLRSLLQARIDAGTAVDLGGSPVRAVLDDWLLFLVPKDASKALNLSVRSTVYPWAYYDLTSYGLPRLLVRFDKGEGARLWALPAP